MIPESQGENYRKQETSKLDERDRVRRESPCLASLEIEAHLNSHFSYAGPGTKAPGVGALSGTLGPVSPPGGASKSPSLRPGVTAVIFMSGFTTLPLESAFAGFTTS